MTTTVGIYRLEKDGSFTVIADIGACSEANPPATDFFITTGVQYALQKVHGRLPRDRRAPQPCPVGLAGRHITELMTFGNIVPTGLETSGNKVYMGRAGPVPHLPENGRVLAFRQDAAVAREVARGASMVVDVELGGHNACTPCHRDMWDGEGEGSPAFPDTGRLVKVEKNGSLTPLRDGSGKEIVLDRPTSLEFVGNTAYVVSLSGAVVKIKNVFPRH